MAKCVQLKSNASSKSSAQQEARFAKREWIISRADVLLDDFHRSDLGEAFETASKMQWADVLEGLPREVINKGIIEYQRHGPRSQKTKKLMKPAPGDIYFFSIPFLPKLKVNAPQPEPKRLRVTPEATARIREELGFPPLPGATYKPKVLPGSKSRSVE